jgi:hypothetical protein
MSILKRSERELEDLLGGRVRSVEEIDLVTGALEPVFGPRISPIARPEAVRIMLSDRMHVASFIPIDRTPVEIRGIQEGLSLLYQRNWTALLLSSSLRPLDPEAPTDAFYDDIAMRLMNAMKARYVIMRRIVTDGSGTKYLRCEAIQDRSGKMDMERRTYDIASSSPSLPIYDAVETSFRDSADYLDFIHKQERPEVFEVLAGMPGTEKIQTIVISAMTLGDTVRGFINVGYDFRFELNEYLTEAFATTFNHVCAAIENHHTMSEISGLRGKEFGAFVARSNLEFIQGFRHMAQTALVEADIASRKMLPYYNYKGDRKVDPSTDLQTAHSEIEAAFTRMAALKNLNLQKSKASLVAIAESAKNLVSQQIDNAEADVRIVRLSGGTMEAVVNAEMMQHAFGNLLLNSLDAFNEVNLRKANRRVTFQFKEDRDSILIDVIDEGPGIRLQGNVRQTSDIWLPERTTKQKGTGYGLPFVRKIIQEIHNGSIDLKPSSRGAIFGIVLRKDGHLS